MSSQKQKNHARIEYLKALEEKERLLAGLPHLYRYKFYHWSKKFFESTNRFNFLTAANQIGKSTVQIIKAIDWATNKTKWPTLWRTEPRQFWYLYPTKDIATTEVYEKWIPDILPAGEYKQMGAYSWTLETDGRHVKAIHFTSGVSIYFKTYAQDETRLQAGTVHAIFCDEELPDHLFEELNFRLSAVDGYYHNVFTATLGQEKWRKVMQPGPKEEELYPNAFKMQVSTYDCLTFEDGTNSHWTIEKIELQKAFCRSEAEIQKRIYGRFVVDEGLKYPGFSPDRNIRPYHFIPPTWHLYAGLDWGSGDGDRAHKSAIVFVGVNPEFTEGRVFLGWRGDQQLTTASDLFTKYQMLKGSMEVTGYFDWACKDLGTIAERLGEVLLPADKGHETGEQILNVLFKSNMLYIYDTPELQKLVGELQSLKTITPKKDAKDDLCDALRYAVTQIPWDWSVVRAEKKEIVPPRPITEQDRRKAWVLGHDPDDRNALTIDDEIDAWNELYD